MITLDTDTSDCPGAICKIVSDDGRDVLVKTDWDAPGVASTFGWSVSQVGSGCEHDGTDGTVACKACGTTAGKFIEAAIDFINEHDGEAVEDPGYFA